MLFAHLVRRGLRDEREGHDTVSGLLSFLTPFFFFSFVLLFWGLSDEAGEWTGGYASLQKKFFNGHEKVQRGQRLGT